VGDLERRDRRDRQRRRGGGVGQPGPDETGLGDPVRGQGRLRLALEAALDDERRLAVADEDERRVETVGDEAAGRVAGRCT
jgi:hypothetical protein